MAGLSNPQNDRTQMLPHEILRDILHRVAFIPYEWDARVSSNCARVFGDYNIHVRAWEASLPFRVAITRVSRRWRAIALEFLYGSFHDTRNGSRLESFVSFLSSYPYYGTLVRRLTMHPKGKAEKLAVFTGVLRRCPNLLILSVIDHRSHTIHPRVLSDSSILPTSLKQLDASVAALSASSIFALLTHLPQLEILYLHDIREDLLVAHHTKTVLPNLRILQLLFFPQEKQSIVRFLRSLDFPPLSAMGIGQYYKGPIPAFPKELSEHLKYLDFCLPYNEIDEWKAEDFRNLCQLRLDWDQLRSASFRSHLPMNQIVELTCTLPSLAPESLKKEGVVDRMMSFPLDPSMMPQLKSFTVGRREAIWNHTGKLDLTDHWVSDYFEALAASFDRRGVELWFDQPDLLKESILVRDMICMLKTK